jgi:MoaA/NifB/PqqE/SkfB family radical SAM enzyme
MLPSIKNSRLDNLDYDFTISSHCNAACPSCKRYESHNNPIDIPEPIHPRLNQIHMDFDIFKSIIQRDIHMFTNKNVTYEGELGDPMVHPHVKSFIDFGAGIFKMLKVVTNGGMRTPKFFNDLGNTYRNLEIMFSIDGLHDDLNGLYRRRVKTQKAIDNMITFSKSKYGYENVSWQYIIFEHNWFEIPEVLDFAKLYNIPVVLKINTRPKFRIKERLIPSVINQYERNKFRLSKLVLAN